jgi:hypothetical protein
MQNNLMLFSELQKKLSPSPIKTWRLLKQLRDDGHMIEPDDYLIQDRKLYVNVLRFIVELEHIGYANLKSDDFKNDDMKSDEIKELLTEMRLISNEITESRIQEEMKSPDFTSNENKQKVEQEDPSTHSGQQNMKSPEINNGNLKSDDFSVLAREIITTKNEHIDTLKGSVADSKEENAQLRKMLAESLEHNKSLTTQITFLSNLLAAPKQETEPMRSAKVRVTEVTDEEADEISDEITHGDDTDHQTNPDTDTSAEQPNQERHSEKIMVDEETQSVG